ncbi:MAG: LysM peptidoglycan-binding protein [Flavisolibacter sp.]|jgi:LysM repeat protein|nr:LysM peptidoglycan-binding protein [Flavisolibacter sp.]
MKKFLFITLALFFASWLHAQEIIARHSDKGLYVSHTVAAKETFYSLGRLYAIPPKDIAALNNLDMEKGLNIGQIVNIPLTAANFSQDVQKGQPVYYVVGEKEGLYRVSVNNNKVLMANLRKWNGLKADAVSAGQKLIVGFIPSHDGAAVANKTVVPEKKEPLKMPEEKTGVAVNEEKPVEKKAALTEKKAEAPRISNTAVNDGNGGYFKASFDQQVKGQPIKKDDVATAGIFKTASGWQDAKYYALIDGVEPGTIIRITNPNNSKAIYAKVLDKMTGIRQNQGYTIRVSNAAATALNIADTEKFSVRVNY